MYLAERFKQSVRRSSRARFRAASRSAAEHLAVLRVTASSVETRTGGPSYSDSERHALSHPTQSWSVGTPDLSPPIPDRRYTHAFWRYSGEQVCSSCLVTSGAHAGGAGEGAPASRGSLAATGTPASP